MAKIPLCTGGLRPDKGFVRHSCPGRPRRNGQLSHADRNDSDCSCLIQPRPPTRGRPGRCSSTTVLQSAGAVRLGNSATTTAPPIRRAFPRTSLRPPLSAVAVVVIGSLL